MLDGAASLTVMTDEGPRTLELGAGMLTVVPRGHWHRFHVPEHVTVLTATPQPSDFSTAEDPRAG